MQAVRTGRGRVAFESGGSAGSWLDRALGRGRRDGDGRCGVGSWGSDVAGLACGPPGGGFVCGEAAFASRVAADVGVVCKGVAFGVVGCYFDAQDRCAVDVYRPYLHKADGVRRQSFAQRPFDGSNQFVLAAVALEVLFQVDDVHVVVYADQQAAAFGVERRADGDADFVFQIIGVCAVANVPTE